MNRKLMEYFIIITAVVILVYGCYSMMSYNYQYFETDSNITDSIIVEYPSSSDYTVKGDNIEFRNTLYSFYDMDVSKLNSSDNKITSLMNHFSKLSKSCTVDFKNENYYLLTMELEDDKGYKYHSIIIPVDTFDRNSLSFSKDCDVYLFDGHDRKFVVDSAFKSEVLK